MQISFLSANRRVAQAQFVKNGSGKIGSISQPRRAPEHTVVRHNQKKVIEMAFSDTIKTKVNPSCS